MKFTRSAKFALATAASAALAVSLLTPAQANTVQQWLSTTQTFRLVLIAALQLQTALFVLTRLH